MKNKKIKIGGNNLLLLITIVLFIVMYGIGCVVYDDKGFGHFQTFLNLLITNARRYPQPPRRPPLSAPGRTTAP